MGNMTQEQAETIVHDLGVQAIKAFAKKDLEQLVSHYHPEAAVVHKGFKSYYGREEIRQAIKSFLDSPDASGEESPVNTSYVGFTPDGKYLIRRGSFHAKGKDWPLELIYKKEGDKYLVYHDEFEYE